MSIFNGNIDETIRGLISSLTGRVTALENSSSSSGGIYKIGIYPFSGSVKGTASSFSFGSTLPASYSITISGFTDTNKMLLFIEDLEDTKINYTSTGNHTDTNNTARISEYTTSSVTVSAGTITTYKSSSWSVKGLLYVVQFL